MMRNNEQEASYKQQALSIFWHKPSAILPLMRTGILIGANYLTSSLSKAKYGELLLREINSLYPEISNFMDKLMSSRSAGSVDDLYDELKHEMNAIFNKCLPALGMNLNDLVACNTAGLGALTEERIKREFLPFLIILRDVPKFCLSIEEKKIESMLADIRGKFQQYVKQNFQDEIQTLLENGKESSGLYRFENQDPALVSQLKKIFNALYKAQKTVVFLNSLKINPVNGFRVKEILEKKGRDQVRFMTKMIWQLAIKGSTFGDLVDFEHDFNAEEAQFIKDIEQTIQDVREAQSSLLEVDIPVYQLFGTELQKLGELIQSLKVFTTSDNRLLLERKFNNVESIAEMAGRFVGRPFGLAISQLDPAKQVTSNSFLIENAYLLPSWLGQITDLIQSFGIDDLTPNHVLNTKNAKEADKLKIKCVSEEDSEKYKKAVNQLFTKLSNIFDKNIFGKAVALYQSSADMNVFLSEGVSNQTDRMNEAAGAAVVYQLFRLKNDRFANVLCQVDKMELYLGLSPGVLTKPVMQQLKTIYETLVTYGNSVIDLRDGYQDLRELDNTSFLTRRLQNILQEKSNCEFKVQTAKVALEALNKFTHQFSALGTETPEERDALNECYQQFKQYVIEYNPRLSVLLNTYLISPSKIAEADMLLLKEFKNSGSETLTVLCEKSIATYTCYAKLADVQLREIPNQVAGDLYALDLNKSHSFLIINEPAIVTGRVEYKMKKANQFVSDLTQLSEGQAGQLYEYHRTRSTTLKFIQDEIKFFNKQLSVNNWFLKPDDTHQILQHYRIVQPYLADSVSDSEGLDSKFVDLLLMLPHINMTDVNFTTVIANTQKHLLRLGELVVKEINRSNSRQLLFVDDYRKVQEKKIVFFDDEALTLQSELVKRQDKWIRHQRLSRASAAMKTTLYNLIHHSDPALGLRNIQEMNDGVPFAEMEDDLEALKTPHQVSWYKRMLNVVHYLNNSFTYLESLDYELINKDDTRNFLKGSLVEGIYHLKPYIELTKACQTFMDLMQEPVGQKVYDALKRNFDDILSYWNQIGPLYAVESGEIIVQNPKNIERGGVWYPLLSLFVAPEHFQALSDNKNYGQHEALLAQKNAKEIAQYIEFLTDKTLSGEYFSLFLRSPYILGVFLPNLKDKLTQFRQVTHGLTMSHLRELQALLQSVLIETDAWEITVGLEPGFLSNPMKLVLDKLFNGFIEPLNIKSEERTDLITNVLSFEKRLTKNEEKRTELLAKIQKEKRAMIEVDTFLQTLIRINAQLVNNKDIEPAEKALLTTQYWNIYPVLELRRNSYEISMDQRDKSAALDIFCNGCLKDKCEETNKALVPFIDLLYLVKHVRAATEGRLRTLQVEGDQLDFQHLSINKAKLQYRPIVDKKVETPIAQIAPARKKVMSLATQVDLPIHTPYVETIELFLSKEAICKQLFHELLEHNRLGLTPGRPCQLESGALLSSSYRGNSRLGIEKAIYNLNKNLALFSKTSEDTQKFSYLITQLHEYKTSSDLEDNLFRASPLGNRPHACAWMRFAPLLINPTNDEVSFKTREHFLEFLENSPVAFTFDTTSPFEKTGLYIAVKTANYKMVNAFLCSEYAGFVLDKETLKTCLSLTSDTKTRLVLLRHSNDLLTWIKDDADIKVNVVASVDELKGLWASWTSGQRKRFIEETSSKLWLGLIANTMSRVKLEKLLGTDFLKLQEKLKQDQTIRNKESLPAMLQYLESDKQFNYLQSMGQELDSVYPTPRDQRFNELLSSLGYPSKGGLKTTRYILPKNLVSSHDQLLDALIKLPVPSSAIIDALQKIEGYLKNPSTQADYQKTLKLVAKTDVDTRYQGMSIVGKFIYNLLNILTFGWYGRSPFLSYIDGLSNAVGTSSSVQVLTSDISNILPSVKDYIEYKDALNALYDKDEGGFWNKLPKPSRKIVIQDPTRFEGVLDTISKHSMDLSKFYNALDKDSLIHFNTLEGVQQLVLETPLFSVDLHMQVLVNKMRESGLSFLGEMSTILDVLLKADDKCIQKIDKFLPGCDDAVFQAKIIEAMPKPLKSESLRRFMMAYHINARKFCELMNEIHQTHPSLLSSCWDLLPEEVWQHWILSQKLPTSTQTLLNAMPFPLRINFFMKMMSNVHRLNELRVIEDKTVDVCYPEEVAELISTNAESADTLFEKLTELRKNKSDNFQAQLADLSTSFIRLNTKLDSIYTKLIPSKTGFFFWIQRFAVADLNPDIEALDNAISEIKKTQAHLKSNSLWEAPENNLISKNLIKNINKSLERTASLIGVLNNINTPENVKNKMLEIAGTVRLVEDLVILRPSIDRGANQSTDLQSINLTHLVDNLSNQFMQLRLNYSVNRNGFFAATTMANRTQKVLLEEINDLRDRVNKLESTLDRQQVSDEIKTNVAKSLERFKNTHRSLQFPVFNSGSVDEKNANSHTAEGNLTELEERIAKLFTTEPPASATSTTTQALH